MRILRAVSGIIKIYGGAGVWGNGLTALAVIAFYGRDKLMETVKEINVCTANKIDPFIPEFSKAWVFLPLLILTVVAFGKEVFGLRNKIDNANDIEDKLKTLLLLREEGLKLKNEFNLDKKLKTLDEWMDKYNRWAESTMPAYSLLAENEALLERAVDYRELIRVRHPNRKRPDKYLLAYEIITERIARIEQCYLRHQGRQLPSRDKPEKS